MRPRAHVRAVTPNIGDIPVPPRTPSMKIAYMQSHREFDRNLNVVYGSIPNPDNSRVYVVL